MATSFTNLQPSLALTQVVITSGLFPSSDSGSATGDTLGFIANFASVFAPGGSLPASGQLIGIATNPALFSLLGTTFGGDGKTTFALPNLDGEAMIGAGGANLAGAATGTNTVTLTTANLPAPGGADQPVDNLQPSLPVQTLICVSGALPGEGAAFIGEVAQFAGNFVPSGWAVANGQTLAISGNEALYSVIGNLYGGDGETTFALPDLNGKLIAGASPTQPVGTSYGSATINLTDSELPPGGTPLDDDQPSVAMQYLICISGAFPSRDDGNLDPSTPTIGQIVAFAGTTIPPGWAAANGQILSIVQNTALFSVLGTNFGGDGRSTFALPNLEGRTIIGADGSQYLLGNVYGTDSLTLAADNVPACFAAGTRIATPHGQIEVERLAIGDLVTTSLGRSVPVKWIGHRRYGGRFLAGNHLVLPVCIKRGAIAPEVPAADLWVSPGHALCLDNALVPAWRLINAVSVIQAAEMESVTYYHIELEEHDVILAENCPAESFFEEAFRNQFENAAQYRALYPQEAGARFMCLPRLEEGFWLQAIQSRLAARAGLAPQPGQAAGPLRGFIDIAGPDIVSGWAQCVGAPEVPVCLDILVGGRRVGRALANHYRPDLHAAGLGRGCHGFTFRLPAGLVGAVQVRRATDDAELAMTNDALSAAA